MQRYAITEKAGRFVAGRNNTGVGTILHLTAKQAEYELSLGTLVAVPEEGEEAAPEAAEEPKVEDLSKLTKDQLVALAAERGVEVDPKATKAQIIAAIEEAAAKAAAA